MAAAKSCALPAIAVDVVYAAGESSAGHASARATLA
jgi:hypothetical protein